MKKFLLVGISSIIFSACVLVAQNRIGQGTQFVVPLNNGNGSGGSATNVVLTGQIVKGASSSTTVIAPVTIGTSNIANSQITAALMANDLDTNIFNATGFTHLIQLIQSVGGSVTPWTSDINGAGFSLTNVLNIGATTVNVVNLNLGTLTVTNAPITVLSPSSNQTNYTVTLGSMPCSAIIHMANTNAFLTFQNTNQSGYQCTVIFRAVTNSIVTRYTVNLPSYMTNLNLSLFVTNGTARAVNFYNIDTSGTNVIVSDAGTFPHN